MKKYLLEHYPTVLLITAMLAAGILWRHSVKEQMRAVDRKNIIDTELGDSVAYYKNALNETVAQKKTLEITVKGLKENMSELSLDKSKLKSQVGNLNNLVSNLRTQLETKGEIAITDTVQTKDMIVDGDRFEFKGEFEQNRKYLDIHNNYTISGEFTFNNSEITFSNIVYEGLLEYNYKVELENTTYWRREPKWKIWKAKELVTDIQVSDPNANVITAQSIVIKQKKRIWERPLVWAIVGLGTGIYLTK